MIKEGAEEILRAGEMFPVEKRGEVSQGLVGFGWPRFCYLATKISLLLDG